MDVTAAVRDREVGVLDDGDGVGVGCRLHPSQSIGRVSRTS
jgi:hypothetical protein